MSADDQQTSNPEEQAMTFEAEETEAPQNGAAAENEAEEGDLTFDAEGGSEAESAASASGDDGEEGDAAPTAGGDGGGSSNIDFAAIPKHDAKTMLDKKTYKKWKQWYKERKSSKHDAKKKDKEKSKKKEHKLAKDKKEKKEKKAPKEKKQSRRTREPADAGDDDGNFGVEGMDGGPMPAGGALATLRVAAKSKLKGTEIEAKRASDAKGTVESMRRASDADAQARINRMPPLNRLAIRPGIIAVAQRPFMHQHLVGCGFLAEISSWLCDTEARELGPLDLRSSALDLLLGFDFEGVSSVRKKLAEAAASKRGYDDLVLDYEGVNADQLKDCNLGGAVNFLRTAPQETRENRIKATTLLERMSRTFHETNDEDEGGGGGAKWPMMNDHSVASPFEVLRTRTEAFMTACVKVDPEDPNSYLKQPPARFPRSFISGLAGSGRQKRDRGDE